MDKASTSRPESAWSIGIKDAMPLMGGYIPVAISFGLIAVQAGFSAWETIAISIFIYAGSAQFLFVAMVASGAPLWLVVSMTLLINARHVVYGPNLAPYISKSRWWIPLMHGLTDQIFALAHTRFPDMSGKERITWYTSAAFIAWFSWIGGTVMGAVAGAELIARWPLLAEVLPFALPSLFLVLLAPRFNTVIWTVSLLVTTFVALFLKLYGWSNAAIPLAALSGVVAYYIIDNQKRGMKSQINGGGNG
jgi:4-azaleucine resistance transporter AzlC